ncbi:CD209 antigen-like protein A isoform X1 [Phodopus roborovskii]|uniref:CD209 antigen-like protein A isoform X1 n=1 Tax=Phodopus roborovskii TaxID=109678 RepID=UPI0021E4B6F5|nr:CD209 antigen-like protein A isoform X1 [Phodopus roborovskii]XP_051061144.1 CD209 antigen-like protein A isoform X1 [Phodopus roborovskii]
MAGEPGPQQPKNYVSRIRGYPQGQTLDQQGSSRLDAVPHEQTYSSLEQIRQQLTQINASLAGLCRPCPWDWELFQESCYLFSKTLGSWEASASSCRALGAHLVIVNSVEEQRFLKYWHIRKNELTWIGLSDHRREGSWKWVDDSPLQLSFWREGEPNNDGDEDCVELAEDKWNDRRCTANNFWVCEQPSDPCPGH